MQNKRVADIQFYLPIKALECIDLGADRFSGPPSTSLINDNNTARISYTVSAADQSGERPELRTTGEERESVISHGGVRCNRIEYAS